MPKLSRFYVKSALLCLVLGGALAWLAFWTLNGGLALRAVGEPLAGLRPGPLAATLQLAGILIFVLLTWPRVRSLAARQTRG